MSEWPEQIPYVSRFLVSSWCWSSSFLLSRRSSLFFFGAKPKADSALVAMVPIRREGAVRW